MEPREMQLATVLAGWLTALAQWLEHLLAEQQDGLSEAARRELAMRLVDLRPTLEGAATASSLARAVSELVLLVSGYPPLVERWGRRKAETG